MRDGEIPERKNLFENVQRSHTKRGFREAQFWRLILDKMTYPWIFFFRRCTKERERERERERETNAHASSTTPTPSARISVSSFLSSSFSSALRGGNGGSHGGRKRSMEFIPANEEDVIRTTRTKSFFIKTEAMFDKFTLKNPFQTDPAMKTKERYQPIVHKVNQLEQSISGMTDEELRGQTEKFRQRLAKREGEFGPAFTGSVRDGARGVEESFRTETV